MPIAQLRLPGSSLQAQLRTPAFRLRLLYFLYFAAAGTSLPYLAAYLRGLGFSGSAIGSIQMLPSLLSPLVGLTWAHVADRRGDPVQVLRWVTAWAALSALFLPWAATPLAVGAVVFSMSLGDRALVALLDTVSLEHCRRNPGHTYAWLRLFGSVGFLVLALLLGQVLTLRGDRAGDPVVPASIALLCVGYALGARGLAPSPAGVSGRPGGGELLPLLRNRRLLPLFAAGAVHWAATVPYSLFLGLHVRDLGLPARVTGAAISVAVLAEILVMVAYPRLAARRSARTLLGISFAASSVRWILLSRATSPAALVALQALHGLTYGLFWSILVQLVGALVPAHMRATGQALCQALVFGIGSAVGARLAGLGYDHYGSVGPLFAWSAGADLVLTLLVGALIARRLFLGPPASGTPPPAAEA
jgi:MFS transporter, PPP family, 3-phenylpropionic acid transporter